MKRIIENAKAEKRNLLEPEAKELFRSFGLPVQDFLIARSEAEAVAAAEKLGFPSVLKVVSPDILHKSDIGGVKVRLEDAAQVAAAYREIMENARRMSAVGPVDGQADGPTGARVEGVLVAPYAREGIECIVGMTRDPQFGPALMFGMGGVLVEILKDVSFRVLPIEKRDAEEMVKEIAGFKLLSGVRGEAPRDVPAIVGFLLKTAGLVEGNPDIREIDVNPLMAYEKGVLALDVRVIL
jgi:acetyl-CoA synthetase (ADP-forming)